jgi:hypothetical protein
VLFEIGGAERPALLFKMQASKLVQGGGLGNSKAVRFWLKRVLFSSVNPCLSNRL